MNIYTIIDKLADLLQTSINNCDINGVMSIRTLIKNRSNDFANIIFMIKDTNFLNIEMN